LRKVPEIWTKNRFFDEVRWIQKSFVGVFFVFGNILLISQGDGRMAREINKRWREGEINKRWRAREIHKYYIK